MWIRANPCGPSQAALESLWRSREAQDGLSSSQDQLQDGTTPWTLPGWSRMFSKSKQQLQVTFFSISPGVGGSILCHGLPAALTASRPRWDVVSVLSWGTGGHQDLCQQPDLPSQPGGPRGCCSCRGVVDSDGRWISRRRAGSGVWLQTWGAKAGGGKAGITATDPLVPLAAGAMEPTLLSGAPTALG